MSQNSASCDCFDRAPTAPVFRDVMEHLPYCPQHGSGFPVGSGFKWRDAVGQWHVDAEHCPCKPGRGNVWTSRGSSNG
jgi:hypothetical protein